MKIQIKVKPGSSKQEIRREGEIYVVSLKSKPIEGKANVELLKVLKKEFGNNVKIIKGLTSKNKVIEID